VTAGRMDGNVTDANNSLGLGLRA